ncbi:MAG: hypothetical protein HRT74_11425 [Flavobacteriales bacterium]|nr:hypothetical protein [Flavobacteriales bacterium]
MNLTRIRTISRKSLIIGGKHLLSGFDRHRSAQEVSNLQADQLVKETVQKMEQSITSASIHSNSLERKIILDSGYTFELIPVDDQVNLIYGLKQFASGITVYQGGDIVMTGIFVPCDNELFFAENLRGVKRNNHKIRVNSIAELRHSVLSFVVPSSFIFRDAQLEVLSTLMHSSLKTTLSNAALYNATRVVNGNLSGAVLFGCSQPQIRLIEHMVRTAGGTVTSLNVSGGEEGKKNQPILVSNGLIHDQISQILSGSAVGSFMG